MLRAGCLAGLLVASTISPAQAQMTWTDQGFVNVNLGAQGGSRDVSTQSAFDLYGESGSLATTQEAGGGGLFDFGAGYKVWRNLAVGFSFSRTGSDADAAIAATVPDPNFFDRQRPLTGTAATEYSESAFHFQGTWMMPVTDKVDVGVSFGPSIFRVSQEIATAITVNEPGPTLASTTIAKEKKTAGGINLGVDVNYMFTPNYGAGVLLRYTWGSVDYDAANDSVSVGGLQFGVGFRYRFQEF
jgi:hypothetical protein